MNNISIDWPVVEGDELRVHEIQLAALPPNVPVGMQTPVPVRSVVEKLHATRRQIGVASVDSWSHAFDRMVGAWESAAASMRPPAA